MTVFSSMAAALEFGFAWLDFDEESRLHIVFHDSVGPDGLMVRSLAFARASEEEMFLGAL